MAEQQQQQQQQQQAQQQGLGCRRLDVVAGHFDLQAAAERAARRAGGRSQASLLARRDVSALHALLEHDNADLRARMKSFFAADPIYVPRYDIDLRDDRELAFERLARFCRAGFISVADFAADPRRIFAAHEVAALVDPSMATKMTVQFNLFGGTVLKLGTERHHAQILRGIDDASAMGCFCLTELSYGNNAVEMETTATYDPARQVFDLHSPTTGSAKYWITNGAVHAQWAVVFARLLVAAPAAAGGGGAGAGAGGAAAGGGPVLRDEGIHAFLVRIREEGGTSKPCRGVRIDDMGHKMGCNGVDNGKLAFDHVAVPREVRLGCAKGRAPLEERAGGGARRAGGRARCVASRSSPSTREKRGGGGAGRLLPLPAAAALSGSSSNVLQAKGFLRLRDRPIPGLGPLDK